MTPEETLLRWARPCLDSLNIPDEVKKNLIERIRKRDKFSRQELENTFANITCMMEGFYRSKDKPKDESEEEDYFTSEKIDYFLEEEHNPIVIGMGRDPKSIYWCQTRIATVDGFIKNKVRLSYDWFDPRYDDSGGLFENEYGLELSIGDKVRTHRKFIIKKK